MVDKEGRASREQIVHQEAVLSWGPEHPLRRSLIQFAMADHLQQDPRGLADHAAVGEMLEARTSVKAWVYEASRTSARRPGELSEMRARALAVRNVLRGTREVSDPVFLVNGRYVIATGSVTHAYQVLNWLVRKLREA